MKVFLGGTCNRSTWREKFIPMLKIDYFNPVVEDWTTECLEEEIIQKKLCDFILYTITPKMKGVYSIAEVVDDSNKRPDKTILVTLKEDEDEVFTKGQWYSLTAVRMMVMLNRGRIFNSLTDAAQYLNSFN